MCVIYAIIGLVTVILLALSFPVTAPLLLFGPLVLLALKLFLGLVVLYLIGRGVVWLLGRRRPPQVPPPRRGPRREHPDGLQPCTSPSSVDGGADLTRRPRPP
jgi:hypothetical protein